MERFVVIGVDHGRIEELSRAASDLIDQIPALRADIMMMRRLLGWTQIETAKASGIPVSRWSSIERDEIPSSDLSLQEVLGMAAAIDAMRSAAETAAGDVVQSTLEGVAPEPEPEPDPELLLDEAAPITLDDDLPSVDQAATSAFPDLGQSPEVTALTLKSDDDSRVWARAAVGDRWLLMAGSIHDDVMVQIVDDDELRIMGATEALQIVMAGQRFSAWLATQSVVNA